MKIQRKQKESNTITLVAKSRPSTMFRTTGALAPAQPELRPRHPADANKHDAQKPSGRKNMKQTQRTTMGVKRCRLTKPSHLSMLLEFSWGVDYALNNWKMCAGYAGHGANRVQSANHAPKSTSVRQRLLLRIKQGSTRPNPGNRCCFGEAGPPRCRYLAPRETPSSGGSRQT